jgi:hypothetical protein
MRGSLQSFLDGLIACMTLYFSLVVYQSLIMGAIVLVKQGQATSSDVVNVRRPIAAGEVSEQIPIGLFEVEISTEKIVRIVIRASRAAMSVIG